MEEKKWGQVRVMRVDGKASYNMRNTHTHTWTRSKG